MHDVLPVAGTGTCTMAALERREVFRVVPGTVGAYRYRILPRASGTCDGMGWERPRINFYFTVETVLMVGIPIHSIMVGVQ